MKDFKRHLFNIKNQNREFKSCKENLVENEAAILVDFSENYSCKLAKEIQSYHFGSSRNQATLHTGVFYVGKKSCFICNYIGFTRPQPSSNLDSFGSHI